MNHDDAYSPAYLASILDTVRTIAMVGASPDATRSSHRVLGALQHAGYRMIPVNPRAADREIHGLRCVRSLSAIGEPVDMVQVYRNSEAAYAITEEAIAIGAKVIWMQIGVRNDAAAKLAEHAGLRVVMNRCPKIELARLPRLARAHAPG